MPTVAEKMMVCPGWQTGNLQQLPGARGAPRPDVEFNKGVESSGAAAALLRCGVCCARKFCGVKCLVVIVNPMKRKPSRLASSPLLQERPVGFRFLRYMLGAKLVEMFVVM